MSKEIPEVIKQVGFDFSWDERKVWALDAPVEELPLSELEWHFDIPFLWTKPDGFYDLKPSTVLQHPEQYPEEYERTVRADLRYPIDVMRYRERWVILDGLHRLMKASVQHEQAVRVRKIARSAIPLIQKGDA